MTTRRRVGAGWLALCLFLAFGLLFVGPVSADAATANATTASNHVSATVTVTPGNQFDTSTFQTGAFSLRNTGSDPIRTVEVDLSTAVFPDMVFDPAGTAGDDGQKGFTLDTATGDGVSVVSVQYLKPANGVDSGDGYRAVRVQLSDFEPGETIGFSADIDPTSIKGSGPIQRTAAGPVSGLELAGSRFTVTGTSGTTARGELFGQGTASGASATLESNPGPAPTVDVTGVSLTPTMERFRAATVTAASQQVVVRNAPPGSTVRLLQLEGELSLDGVPNDGYQVSPYEANDLVAIGGPAGPVQQYQERTATANQDGTATFQVSLSRTDESRLSGYNHFIAVANGGLVSGPVVLKYDTGSANRAPTLRPIGDRVVTAGSTLTVPVSATDRDFDAVSLSASGLPDFARFSQGSAGEGTITLSPDSGDVGTYTLTVTASDGQATDTETVVVSVTPAGEAAVAYRVNAGGPEIAVANGPDWAADIADTSPFRNTGSRISDWGSTVNRVTSRVPSGTPGGIWRFARFDPPDGQEMGWTFDVPEGTLTEVRLYFAEGFSDASNPGGRIFDVTIDGAPVLDDYDIVADAGYATGTMRTHTLVSDGTVNVDFGHVFQNPVVSGIEVITYPGGAGDLGALPPSIDFDEIVAGSTANATVSLQNLGSSGDQSIRLQRVSVTGPDATQFSARGSPTTLGPGASAPVEVTFSPQSGGTKRATLEVVHDGSNSPVRVPLTGVGTRAAGVGFRPDGLETDVQFPTTLDWGPDGRLYVAERLGRILALTVERTGTAAYEVTDTEVITEVQDITNHDDDGSVNPAIDTRQVTGLLAAGTPEQPVLYVTSSDPREGGKQAGLDTNLDTNSGTVSRLTKTGSGWNHVQLVRGLPRSEENHSPNGMALDRDNDQLFVAIGGNTGQGAPSKQLAYLPEYAYSTAVVTVDLAAIEAMPTENGAKYDLPTLQGTAEPFGGQDGLNQAIITPDSPVQVFATGLRNPYDLVLTEETGRLYTSDNGGSGGWGDVPVDEGPGGTCTNAPNEGGPDRIDQFHYLPRDFYAGHPNPTRGNPDGAGVYSSAGQLLLEFTTGKTPVPFSMANPAECDFRDETEDGSLTSFPDSTNGLAEYTASNFGGALQGDILAASFTTSGPIWRLGLNTDGTQVVQKQALLSNFGSLPLDVVAVGDDGRFPGTVWAVAYGGDSVIAFEPVDYGGVSVPACTGADDPNLDEDGDGFSNADELAAGTDPCSAGDQPSDHDGDGIPDVVDRDDDNDGRPDTTDPFALDADNGQSTPFPVRYDMEAGARPNTLFDMGFTGLMSNGQDYRSLFERTGVSAGGIAGVFTIQSAGDGTADGAANTQEYGFQFGIAPGEPFLANATLDSPFPAADAASDDQSAGVFVGTGDQDNFVSVRAIANGGNGGVELVREVGGEHRVVATVEEPAVIGPRGIDLRLQVDPSTGGVLASYHIDGETRTVGRTSVPLSWFDEASAVGVLATSAGPAGPFAATYDQISVGTASGVDPGPGTTVIETQEPTPSGNGPGFGVFAALAALVAVALALASRRRLS